MNPKDGTKNARKRRKKKARQTSSRSTPAEATLTLRIVVAACW
jgi:hypothetical protein